MTKEQRQEILALAIRTWGEPAQIDMAVEEMAELTKALCKVKRAQKGPELTAAIENAVEEIADVQIMLDQLRIMLGRTGADVEEAKLERLACRLYEAKSREAGHNTKFVPWEDLDPNGRRCNRPYE